MKKNEHDPEFIRSLFTLTAKGELVWRSRPLDHFPSVRIWKMWNTLFAGTVAGSIYKNGYVGIQITVNGKLQSYYAHRLAWVIAKGHWPVKDLDHINGIGSDNRIDNLRECNHSQNHQNRVSRKNSSSKYLGISFEKSENKWRAEIMIESKSHFLGRFDTEEDAYKAYCDAKEKLHTFNPIVRASA